MCVRRSYPFYIVTYYIKCETSFWAYSTPSSLIMSGMADVKREPGYGSNRDITELMKHMPSQARNSTSVRRFSKSNMGIILFKVRTETLAAYLLSQYVKITVFKWRLFCQPPNRTPILYLTQKSGDAKLWVISCYSSVLLMISWNTFHPGDRILYAQEVLPHFI